MQKTKTGCFSSQKGYWQRLISRNHRAWWYYYNIVICSIAHVAMCSCFIFQTYYIIQSRERKDTVTMLKYWKDRLTISQKCCFTKQGTNTTLSFWLSGKDVLIPMGTLQKQPSSCCFLLKKPAWVFDIKLGFCFIPNNYISFLCVFWCCFKCVGGNWFTDLLSQT